MTRVFFGLMALVMVVAVSGCALLKNGPLPNDHESHAVGIDTQTLDD